MPCAHAHEGMLPLAPTYRQTIAQAPKTRRLDEFGEHPILQRQVKSLLCEGTPHGCALLHTILERDEVLQFANRISPPHCRRVEDQQVGIDDRISICNPPSVSKPIIPLLELGFLTRLAFKLRPALKRPKVLPKIRRQRMVQHQTLKSPLRSIKRG